MTGASASLPAAAVLVWLAAGAGAACQDGGGGAAGPAAGPLEDGAPCADWTECKSSVCVGGVCGLGGVDALRCGRAGAACGARRDCCGGLACLSNICRAPDGPAGGGPAPDPGRGAAAGGTPGPACRSPGPCLALHDELADGTVDRVTLYRYEGCLPVGEEVTRADGRPGSRTERGYDVRGHLAFIEHDMDGDGAIDVRESWVHDVDGRPQSQEVDMGADGRRNQADWLVTFTYHEDGVPRTEEKDFGADGMVDARHAYVYLDGRDHVVEDYVWLTAVDEGIVLYRNHHVRSGGRLLSIAHDMHADGVMQWRRAFRYDPDGRLTEETQDTGDDGTVEYRITYTYDCWQGDGA